MQIFSILAKYTYLNEQMLYYVFYSKLSQYICISKTLIVFAKNGSVCYYFNLRNTYFNLIQYFKKTGKWTSKIL